ncbi:heme ABC transporter ATP-binding protein [Thorsellia anophelis]|uniref:Iron complex transport system ATP-binding protein n=1 Tax=Thorsellia anophelis DSM 18579 TaxID=1123402 RepID=A0A1I0EDF5_9GAMM|nr:heme ABC transporter ATP-binding protein [Thorsellia anophelis]SET43285.1 iron complex transport system ATP-binding protein [Thorsellia anophelis DSM 18579]
MENSLEKAIWLKANQLSFKIGSKYLLKDINLSIENGEFVGILGPNGAGKSTLIKLLSGFLKPFEGEIFINEKKINEYPLAKLAQLRAVMQQHLSMNIGFNVIDVILFGQVSIKSTSSSLMLDTHYHSLKTDSALIEIIELTECNALLNRNIQSLSGGEQQRVHLARTLYQIWSNTSDMVGIFLDEPTSALDLYYQQNLLRLLKNIAKEKKIAICAILHDVNLAALYADRLIVLNNGVVKLDAPPHFVLTHPEFFNWYRLDGGITYHTEHQSIPQIYLKR